MKTAIFGTSLMANEKRIPIHPSHFDSIDPEILKKLYFEEGYATDFGFDIENNLDKIGGILSRKELFNECDILILPKMSSEDNQFFKEGQIVFGWAHCVQGKEITQTAIDKKLTLVAFEAMFSGNADYKHHVFHKNNEIAGFASVQHSTQLRGLTGYYGGVLKASVFGFGSTSRGAIHALTSQGISDITVYTRRALHLIQQQIPGVKYKCYFEEASLAYSSESGLPLVEEFKCSDIIVNCVMQDPNNPVFFMNSEDKKYLKDNAVIVDVSCDKAMGFDFAIPTTFDEPGFVVNGTNAYYYAVDHTPTLYWNTSSFELSLSLLPYLTRIVTEKGYREDKVLLNALEIESGTIINNSIIKFQRRELTYPHVIIL